MDIGTHVQATPPAFRSRPPAFLAPWALARVVVEVPLAKIFMFDVFLLFS